MASLQQTIDEIFDKYHTSITTGETSSSSDYYYIDNANEEDFNILCNIIEYTTFKNLDKCNDAETTLSRDFSDILIDYVRQGLNYEQVDELLRLVITYNEAIDKAKTETVSVSKNNVYPKYLELIFGIKLTNTVATDNTPIQKISFLNKGYAKRLYDNLVKMYIYDKVEFDKDSNSNIFYYTIDTTTNTVVKNFVTKDNMKSNEFDYTKYQIYTKSGNTYTRIYEPISDDGIYYTNRILEIPIGNDVNSDLILSNLLYCDNGVYYKRQIVDADYLSEADNEVLKYVIYKYIMQARNNNKYNPNEIRLVNFTNEKLSNNLLLLDTNQPTAANNLVLYLSGAVTTTNAKEDAALLLNSLGVNTTDTHNYKVIFTKSSVPYSKTDTSGNELYFGISVNNNKDGDNNITSAGYINKNYFNNYTDENGHYCVLNEYTITIYKTVVLDAITDVITDTTNMTTDILIATYTSKLYSVINGNNTTYKYILEALDTSYGTNSLLTANTDFDEISIKSGCYDVKTYENIRNNALNITVDIAESSEINGTEVLLADDNSVAYMTKNCYPTVITLKNISPANVSSLQYFANKYNISVDNSKKYNIYILYKELNSEYYSMINCEPFDNMVAAYIYNTGTKISDQYFPLKFNSSNDTKLYDSDVILALKDKSVNQYNARITNDNDIVIIQAGESNGLNDEYSETLIESFKTIYTSVRNYFYDVLYNDAFVLDSKYRAFIFTYLIGVTLERYFTYKLDNITDISSYSLNECYDFLDNYGLSNISTLAQSTTVSNKIKILRAICGYYSDLMRYKGSKHVIDVIEEMFNNAGTKYEILLYKYLIYGKYSNCVFDIDKDNSNTVTKVTENSNDIVFTPVKYSNSLSNSSITTAEYNSEKYNSFITSDKYWNLSTVSEDDIKQLDISPTVTKYLALSVSVNIGEDAITNAYALSSMNYMLDKLNQDHDNNTDNNTDNKPALQKIVFGIGSYIGKENVNISIYQVYELYKCLLSTYVIQCGGVTHPNSATYYGINSEASYNELWNALLNNGFVDMLENHYNTKINKDMFNNIFKSDTVTVENGCTVKVKDENGNKTETADTSTKIIRFLVNEPDTNESLYNEIGIDNIVLLPILGKITNNMLNILNDNTTDGVEYNYIGAESLDTVYSILNDINLVISLNSNSDTKIKNVDIMNAYIAYNALKSDVSQTTYDSKIGGTVSNPTSTTIYNYLLKPVLSFVHNYLTGKYSQLYFNSTEAFNYNTLCAKFLDALFTTFFTTDESLLYTFEEIKNTITSDTGRFKDFDTSTRNLILDYIFDGVVSKNNETYDFNSIDNSSVSLSNQLEKITNILAQFDTWYGLSGDYLCVTNESSASADAAASFMTNIINMFISYTTDLYLSNVTYDYNNQNERLKYSEVYSDKISMDIDDFVYTNENITYNINKK